MFEKEAEEYAEKHAFRVPYDGSNKFYDDKDYECSKEGFQQGAEFGYNKANEWHYMKDGDFPKENKKYWVLTSNREPKVDSWLSVSWVNSYDVIAWKEIVFSELKENEFKTEMFPKIILPKGSAEFVDKVIADAEKRLKENE